MPLDCQICLVPGIKKLYFWWTKTPMINSLVNKDRTFQDELGVDYIMLNVTGNTNSTAFNLTIMPHAWEFDTWWKLYIFITFAWGFFFLFWNWTSVPDKKLVNMRDEKTGKIRLRKWYEYPFKLTRFW